MAVFYEDTYHIGAADLDLFGQCRPSAVMTYLQEAATQAGAALHVSRDEIVDRYHAFWMLARIRYELKRPLKWDEPLTVRTWHRGGKSALMYREFDLLVGEELVGQALSAWVMADLDTHKLLHLRDVAEFEGSDGGELCRTDTLRKVKTPEGLILAEKRPMRYSDTDMNGHVNNVRYADFASDALHLETLEKGKFVSALQLGYLSECMAGEEISLWTGERDGQWFVAGRGSGGEERFDAVFTLEDLPE